MSTLTLPDGAVYKTGDSVVPVDREHWDGETIAGVLVAKSSDELRYTLTVGYPADAPDAAVARDGHLDFASPAEVRKAAWGFMRSPEVGARHEDGTEGAGTIVESYVWPDGAPDWRVRTPAGSEYVVKSGDWLIGTVWGETAWQGFKSGEFGGTSMQGTAKRKTPTPADVARIKATQRG